MIKKLIIFLMIFVLSIQSVGCTNNTNISNKDIIAVNDGEESKEINILVYEYLNRQMDSMSILYTYGNDFEKELGVKVNFQVFGEPKYVEFKTSSISYSILDNNWQDDFFKELNTKLLKEDGPELILVNTEVPINPLIEQGAVLNVKNEIKNLQKVYAGLLNEEVYYVPIAMRYETIGLNKRILNELNIEIPGLDWTRQDYLDIKNKWEKNEPVRFLTIEYKDTILDEIKSLNFYDDKNNKVHLNTPQVINAIQQMRNEVFSGKYILEDSYTHDEYYNMFNEILSDEFKQHIEIEIESNYYNKHIKDNYAGNGLRVEEISNVIRKENKVVLPQFSNSNNTIKLNTYGFLINRNGKNIDLALEYINGLLSNDIQMDIFSNSYYDDFYPVNSEIEKDIKNMELKKNVEKDAVVLKDYILSLLYNPNIKIEHYSKGIAYESINKMIIKDFIRFIFSNSPYSEEELKKELQKLENKCNIYLNE